MSQPDAAVTLPAETAPPRWIAPWLALLAPLYVISPLALLALPQLKKLPLAAKYILTFYAISQQLPALFSPEPLLASVLALGRTLLMFGLMGVGIALGSIERLKPFAIGLGVIFVTAIVYSILGGLDVLTGRLSHPYMTPITLGLSGAFGIWIALFRRGRLLWRIPLGVGALVVLLLSGSRGPLAAALLGCIAGFIIRRGKRTATALLVGTVLLIGGFLIGDRLGVGAVSRLSSSDTTGRDLVWYNTLSVIRSQPLTGVGSYRLGKYLAPPGDSCTLFAGTNGQAAKCPTWISNLGSPWLIAHNVALQQLAETGPLGLLGLFLLLGTTVVASIQSRSALGLASVTGLMIATINDNTLLLPSPFFAEVFWLVCGLLLMGLRPVTLPAGLLSGGAILTLSVPVLAGSLFPSSNFLSQLTFLQAPLTVKTVRSYQVIARFELPPGEYRASLDTCTDFCVTLTTLPFTSGTDRAPVLTLQGDLRTVRRQRVELRLLAGKSSLNLHPLGIRSWTVTVVQ
jgi:O-antigen ligase